MEAPIPNAEQSFSCSNQTQLLLRRAMLAHSSRGFVPVLCCSCSLPFREVILNSPARTGMEDARKVQSSVQVGT